MSSGTLRVLEGTIGEPMRSGEAAAPPGSFEGGRVLDPPAVGQALRSLIARTEITTSRALIAVSDALASFRVLTFPRSASDSDISAAVASQVSLGPEHLASRHVEVPLSRDERTVYAAVWDRAHLEAIVAAARQAGLEPAAADLKSLCLARALTVDSCVLVDTTLQPGEVVLIDQRIPRVRHTVKIDPEGDLASQLATAVKAVVSFHQRSGSNGYSPNAPIVLRSGEPVATLVSGRIHDLTGRVVEPIAQPARVDGNLRVEPFLACIGLLMRRSN
jgi:hypothetical protein